MSRTVVTFEKSPAGTYMHELFVTALRARAVSYMDDLTGASFIIVTIFDPFSSMEPRR